MKAKELNIDDAVAELRRGGLVGMPTETVYGLAGDASNPHAVSAIFKLKNRPHFNPLIAHVSSLDMAEQQAVFSETAKALALHYWPGPLTLVLPVATTNSICDLARAGLDTQALRFPSHPVARNLIESFGAPIVAPSANKSGRISPTERDHVSSEFGGDLPIILDGGVSVLGLESTVLFIDDNQVTLLRSGTLTREEIEGVVGPISSSLDDDTAPRSPGMLSRHYAPDAKLRLNVTKPHEDENLLGFGECDAKVSLNLSPSGNLQEAAANLYAMLRELDSYSSAIAVSPIPDTGIGVAINDRLKRAAKQS